MKLAIHHKIGSYSQHWIAYCKEKKISYKIVNCYDSDIVQQLEDCDALMWHHNHANPKDKLFAKQLLYSLETAGKVVYPDQRTTWHFDDKLGQKYLLEAMELPVVPAFAFYSKKEALKWVLTANFPLVHKLRSGAASGNVKLVRNKNEAVKIINKAFGKGFRQHEAYGGIKESIRKYLSGSTSLKEVIKSIAHIFYPIQLERSMGREKGYVYFQEFIANCSFDLRVKVINDKCWAFKRMVRKNDFRASGSGVFEFSEKTIPLNVVKIALDAAKKLSLQSVAFDILETQSGEIKIIELSYAFGYDEGENYGFWDNNFKWHPGYFNPFGWMVENVISKVNERKNNL